MNTSEIRKSQKIDISSLSTIPYIINSRIVEHVPHPGEIDVKTLTTANERSWYYGLSATRIWVNDSAKVQTYLSFCLNESSAIIDQIVEDQIKIVKRNEELNPDFKILENKDFDVDFKNLLKMKIKYMTIVWLMENGSDKYYLKQTDEFQEISKLYDTFKTESSEMLLGNLYQQFLTFKNSSDLQIKETYSKFFDRFDYSEESSMECIRVQATLLAFWTTFIKCNIERINEKLIQLDSKREIEFMVEKIMEEKFRNEKSRRIQQG